MKQAEQVLWLDEMKRNTQESLQESRKDGWDRKLNPIPTRGTENVRLENLNFYLHFSRRNTFLSTGRKLETVLCLMLGLYLYEHLACCAASHVILNVIWWCMNRSLLKKKKKKLLKKMRFFLACLLLFLFGFFSSSEFRC